MKVFGGAAMRAKVTGPPLPTAAIVMPCPSIVNATARPAAPTARHVNFPARNMAGPFFPSARVVSPFPSRPMITGSTGLSSRQ